MLQARLAAVAAFAALAPPGTAAAAVLLLVLDRVFNSAEMRAGPIPSWQTCRDLL